MDRPEIKILIKKRKKLIKKFLSGNEKNFIEKHASLIDEYFYTVFEKSITARKMTFSSNPFAIIALGGYGRQEQCIHSDVDVLILFKERVPPEVEAFVQEIIYPLWDAKIEVGYAVRDIKECIQMSFERFDILTTILDARFLCGASPIYISFMEEFRSRLYRKHLKKNLRHIFDHSDKRHLNYGDSTYLISPHIKSGLGGLRDYHNFLWYAKIRSGIKNRKDLEYYGFLSHFEYHIMEKSLYYIWNVRNILHQITKRKCDLLHFEYQTEVADLLSCQSKKKQPDVEIFLGELHARMNFLKYMNHIILENKDNPENSRIKKKYKTRPSGINGIVIKKKRLYFANTLIILQKPDLLLKIFLKSGKTKMPLSIEAMRIISEFLHLVDDYIKKDKKYLKIFEKILFLSCPEFNVLNLMLATGILERIIPEFSSIVNKIQYNLYHLYPIDKHSLRCVQIINSFKEPGESMTDWFYSSVFRDIREKNVLIMAALLHDIGKSNRVKEHSKRGAEIAEPILKRLNLNPIEIKNAVFLIKNHLLLIKTATRRDIYDEETAVYTANKTEKIKLLKMLYLLTVADSRATGPKAWNKWTEGLLKDLFLKTLNILKKGELASRKTKNLIFKKKKKILEILKGKWQEDEIKKQLDSMSKRYLLYVSPQDIAGHINLYRKMNDKDFIWEVSKERGSEIRTVSICARDKPGIYSKIAGVFFLNNLNIVASQAYSMGNNHILDIFNIMPPTDRIFETKKWEKAENDLMSAISNDNFLDQALEEVLEKIKILPGSPPIPTRVKIDNETSSFFTIIEVFTYDFPGLLFSITNSLYRNGINVNVAMVATNVDQVIDIFYVRNFEDDRKIEDEKKLENIKETILRNLPKIYEKEIYNEKNRGNNKTFQAG